MHEVLLQNDEAPPLDEGPDACADADDDHHAQEDAGQEVVEHHQAAEEREEVVVPDGDRGNVIPVQGFKLCVENQSHMHYTGCVFVLVFLIARASI